MSQEVMGVGLVNDAASYACVSLLDTSLPHISGDISHNSLYLLTPWDQSSL